MNRLAEKIKTARIEAKLSEKDLAKKCGLSLSYLLAVESGKKVINEQIANQILDALGESIEFIDPKIEAQNAPVKTQTPVKTIIKSNEKSDFEPTSQWKNALSNIVKSVPIHELDSWNVVGYKEHPVIENKVEGYNGDKLLYVKMTNNSGNGLRLKANDRVLLHLTSEMHNNQIYLIEYNQKRVVRKLMKVNNKEFSLISGLLNDSEIVAINKIKIIGKCIRAEFDL